MRLYLALLCCFVTGAAAAGDYAAQDKRLNQVYQEYSKKLPPEHKQQLIKAQRAWIKFRDEHCSYMTIQYRDGGSFGPTAYNVCIDDVTADRVKQLEYLNTCTEGDMTCPHWN